MSGAMELLRAAQEGDRDACEQAVIENNGLIWSVVRRYCSRGWTRRTSTSWDAWVF